MNVMLNNEKNGIEISFDSKPNFEILDKLKTNGFRWSGKQKIWYTKQSPASISFVKSISADSFSLPTKNISEKNEYDLWGLTRTDNIGNNFETYKIYDTKKIASIIRKHVKPRFPMCKFSITSDYHSINIKILESPFEKDSDELKAIVHYVYKFAESYNYDNSDIMSDYFDVNFYGVYENSIIGYDYIQREITDSEMIIRNLFKEKKTNFDILESERLEKEKLEREAKLEIERAETKRLEIERNKKHEIIESNVKIKDVNYFVLNCIDTGERRLDSLQEYGSINESFNRINNKISREVHFSQEIYTMFTEQLMDDYSFLAHMGGSSTDDLRINSDLDWQYMSAIERESVEWYNYKCIAVFCENQMKFIIDPQGFSYCRYIYFVDDNTSITEKYSSKTGISENDYKKYKILAKSLEDVSSQIIFDNNLRDTWNNISFDFYKNEMKNWIYENNFELNSHVVRCIEIIELKSAMYKLLDEINGIQEQFERANIKESQKITIIKIDDMLGGLSVTNCYFKKFEAGSYAQYDRAVKFVYRPKQKRQDYYKWLYNDVIIFDDWLEIPNEILWEESISSTGLVVRKAKYGSFDKTQYVAVLEYFENIGIKPIINTVKL